MTPESGSEVLGGGETGLVSLGFLGANLLSIFLSTASWYRELQPPQEDLDDDRRRCERKHSPQHLYMRLVGSGDPVACFGESLVGVCNGVASRMRRAKQHATGSQGLDLLRGQQYVKTEHKREHEYAKPYERETSYLTGRQCTRAKERDDHRCSREQRSGPRTQITNHNMLFVECRARYFICDSRNLLRRFTWLVGSRISRHSAGGSGLVWYRSLPAPTT